MNVDIDHIELQLLGEILARNPKHNPVQNGLVAFVQEVSALGGLAKSRWRDRRCPLESRLPTSIRDRIHILILVYAIGAIVDQKSYHILPDGIYGHMCH